MERTSEDTLDSPAWIIVQDSGQSLFSSITAGFRHLFLDDTEPLAHQKTLPFGVSVVLLLENRMIKKHEMPVWHQLFIGKLALMLAASQLSTIRNIFFFKHHWIW
ncbi:hypothetical protein ACJX0J_011701, partial [Zea mays]